HAGLKAWISHLQASRCRLQACTLSRKPAHRSASQHVTDANRHVDVQTSMKHMHSCTSNMQARARHIHACTSTRTPARGRRMRARRYANQHEVGARMHLECANQHEAHACVHVECVSQHEVDVRVHLECVSQYEAHARVQNRVLACTLFNR